MDSKSKSKFGNHDLPVGIPDVDLLWLLQCREKMITNKDPSEQDELIFIEKYLTSEGIPLTLTSQQYEASNLAEVDMEIEDPHKNCWPSVTQSKEFFEIDRKNDGHLTKLVYICENVRSMTGAALHLTMTGTDVTIGRRENPKSTPQAVLVRFPMNNRMVERIWPAAPPYPSKILAHFVITFGSTRNPSATLPQVCARCAQPPQQERKYISTACSHLYCTNCFYQWVRSGNLQCQTCGSSFIGTSPSNQPRKVMDSVPEVDLQVDLPVEARRTQPFSFAHYGQTAEATEKGAVFWYDKSAAHNCGAELRPFVTDWNATFCFEKFKKDLSNRLVPNSVIICSGTNKEEVFKEYLCLSSENKAKIVGFMLYCGEHVIENTRWALTKGDVVELVTSSSNDVLSYIKHCHDKTFTKYEGAYVPGLATRENPRDITWDLAGGQKSHIEADPIPIVFNEMEFRRQLQKSFYEYSVLTIRAWSSDFQSVKPVLDVLSALAASKSTRRSSCLSKLMRRVLCVDNMAAFSNLPGVAQLFDLITDNEDEVRAFKKNAWTEFKPERELVFLSVFPFDKELQLISGIWKKLKHHPSIKNVQSVLSMERGDALEAIYDRLDPRPFVQHTILVITKDHSEPVEKYGAYDGEETDFSEVLHGSTEDVFQAKRVVVTVLYTPFVEENYLQHETMKKVDFITDDFDDLVKLYINEGDSFRTNSELKGRWIGS